ncbi:type 2 periplasmic-binding domain-containing protein [[Mycoplasma] collis]|uniref:hypothetical protein n=1 Tax=[Mycoplasma] collis TaxID=2127 RepID=UPI00051BB57E|nr:hypothetical protein [[Mycoplasma] collis]
MKKNKKIFLWIIFIFTFLFAFSFLTIYKIKRPYRPLIMNYQSYLEPDIQKNIEKDFSYQEFSEINEFEKLLQDNRTIGGVSSDFAIVQKIKKNLLKKVDYAYLFKDNKELSEKFASKELKIRKQAFTSLVRNETINHLDKFNKFLYKIENNQKKYDLDNDGENDELWEYIIPYYVQDKVIAYTTGNYKSNDKLIPLKKHLKKLDENTRKDIQENGITFDEFTVEAIIDKLQKYGYNNFAWTEAVRDNLLLGSENIALKNNNPSLYSGQVSQDENSLFFYKKQIDEFIELIEKVSKKKFSDHNFNFFTSDGLELLTSIIDTNKNPSVAYLYNGDAIDAFYSNDNFSNIEDGQAIKIIRPKNNLVLMDGWVFSKNISKEHEQKLLNHLYENIYKDEDKSIDEMLSKILVNKKYNYIQDENEKRIKQENTAISIDFNQLAPFKNFDYINYTPTFKNSFEILKKLYFNENYKSAYASDKDDEKEIILLLDKNGNTFSKKEKIKFNDIDTYVDSSNGKIALNLYITQQEEQTKNGHFVDENTKKDDKYKLKYSFLYPVNELLESEIKTYYNLRTKN